MVVVVVVVGLLFNFKRLMKATPVEEPFLFGKINRIIVL